MAVITVQADPSRHYKPRTLINAKQSDLTLALAKDYNTAGERLTYAASMHRHARITLGDDPLASARMLYRYLRQHRVSTLNIAGNGLATLSRYRWDQAMVNAWTFEVLAHVLPHWPLTLIRSGGQTGADIAGLVAGYALGVDVLAYMPAGYRQRDANGQDFQNTPGQIEQQIRAGADILS